MEEMSNCMSDSEHNSDQEFFEQGSDEAFKLAFINTFKNEKEQLMSEESEEIEPNIENQENATNNNYEGLGEQLKDLTNSKNDNQIVGIQEEMIVEIKIPPKFKVIKNENMIAFNNPIKMEYYEKYKYNSIFHLWKDQKVRKEMPDDIRKKIKCRFFNKDLKNCINNMLIANGINKKFEFLPQNFISDIKKSTNKLMLDMTLEEIILEYKNYENDNDKEKNLNNIDLLNYLRQLIKENNPKIQRIYNIFKVRIRELFNEYLKSEEFEKSIIKLKEDGNYSDYIKDYINIAEDFVNYYSK